MTFCHALTVALRHSLHGIILFDTGVAPRINEVTKYWPNRMYRWVVQFDCRPETSLVCQLRQDGIAPHDVKFIVLSHAHADHVGGLLDFPDSKVVLSNEALKFASSMRGPRAVMNAFLPELMPEDLEGRARGVSCTERALDFFSSFDLFGDGSALLIDLPGHAPGHLGMLTRVGKDNFLFVADACWHSRSVTHGEPPHWAASLIVHDWKTAKTSIGSIQQFLATQPECHLVPSHCPLAAEKYLNLEAIHAGNAS